MSVGDSRVAERELQEALQRNPNNVLAAVLLTQLFAGEDRHAQTARLEAMLQNLAPSNPALLVMKMSRAVAEKKYTAALRWADEASAGLPLPARGSQPTQEAANLGNSLLAFLQVLFAAEFDRTRCLEIAGWVYATQARYPEAEQFLARAYQEMRDARTGERLGQVRARRQD